MDALLHHGVDEDRVLAAPTAAGIDDKTGGDVKLADGAGASRPPKLRILLEVRSWNSGLNGDEVCRLLRRKQLATADGSRLIVVKAPLLVRRAYTTLRRALRKAAPEGGPLSTLVPYAPALDLARLSAEDAALAAGEYDKLATTGGEGPDPQRHFLDLDDDGSAPLASSAGLERSLRRAACEERAAALRQAGASLTAADAARLAPSVTREELLSEGGDAVIVFGDPTDVEAPLRAAEALRASGAPVLVVSGAFGPGGPDALAAEVERRAGAAGQPPWRHTRRWRGTGAPPAAAPAARPWPLPPRTDAGTVDERVMKSTAEPCAARFLTEADCYLELLLGRLEEIGYFAEGGPLGKLEPGDVSIERDS